jgi:hypothetical protein
MTAARPARIEPGVPLVFRQDDYCYGTGDLRLLLPSGGTLFRTEVVRAPDLECDLVLTRFRGVVPAGVEWLPMRGTEMSEDRRPIGERYALVRVEAIPEALAAGQRWHSRAHPERGPERS